VERGKPHGMRYHLLRREGEKKSSIKIQNYRRRGVMRFSAGGKSHKSDQQQNGRGGKEEIYTLLPKKGESALR